MEKAEAGALPYGINKVALGHYILHMRNINAGGNQ
jgi:hypothetical protein